MDVSNEKGLYSQIATDEEDTKKPVHDLDNGKFQVSVTSLGPSHTSKTFLFIAASVVNIAAYTCGTAFGWTSPEIPLLTDNSTTPLTTILTESDASWIGSLLPVGAAIGPFAAGIIADKIGRKKSLILGIVPFIITFITSAFATSVNILFAARFLCGLGVGVIFTVLPMYIGEISTNELRGALGSFMQLFITFGLTFSYSAGPYVSIKLFNFMCVVAPTAFIILFYIFIPESPYYLIQSNDEEGAQKALMKLRASNKNGVRSELKSIKSSVEESLSNKASFMDIFKSNTLTKAFIISIGLVSFQQLSGINIIIFYSQDIFTAAGSTIPPEICTIIIGVVQILSSALTPILVEKRGKRFLLLLSAVGMTIFQAVIAYYFYMMEGGKDVSSIGWLPVAALICYIITYCLGFGPLPWAVMGELFPANVKSVASTMTASECWFLGFIITKYFSVLTGLIGKSGSFGIFSAMCVAAGFFVYKYLPETSGKSLQEIQEILGK